MIVEKKKIDYQDFEIVTYDSLSDFYKYICDTPINEAFRWASHMSNENSEEFTKTENFEQAVDLFKNGWEDMANKLTQKLKLIESQIEPTTKQKTIYDVQGFQCSVPRYLQGVPTNMVAKKNFPAKQKVITVVKSIDYNGATESDTIVEESIKALQIVKKLEAQGYRINLDILLGSYKDKAFAIRIRIKSANERMNISKLAFPLVHPSMLRRLLFRWIEVYPTITSQFIRNYGRPTTSAQQRKMMNEHEYLLPSFIKKDITQINGLEDLENL